MFSLAENILTEEVRRSEMMRWTARSSVASSSVLCCVSCKGRPTEDQRKTTTEDHTEGRPCVVRARRRALAPFVARHSAQAEEEREEEEQGRGQEEESRGRGGRAEELGIRVPSAGKRDRRTRIAAPSPCDCRSSRQCFWLVAQRRRLSWA